jgi:transposase
VKTDRRDARTLAEALRLDAYRPAPRSAEGPRHGRAELAVRATLVRTRTRSVGWLKALVRREGLRLPSGMPEHAATTVAAVPVSPMLATELAPLLALLPALNAEIAAADQRLAAGLAANAVVQRLATAPAIGPVTATAFVATLDDIPRCASAHQVEAYLGLVPSERSSGERQRRGRITKAGKYVATTSYMPGSKVARARACCMYGEVAGLFRIAW